MKTASFEAYDVRVMESDFREVPIGFYDATINLAWHRDLRSKKRKWVPTVSLGGFVWGVLVDRGNGSATLAIFNSKGQPMATIDVEDLPEIPSFDGCFTGVSA